MWIQPQPQCDIVVRLWNTRKYKNFKEFSYIKHPIIQSRATYALPIAMRSCVEFHYTPLTGFVLGSVPFGGTVFNIGLKKGMMDLALHWFKVSSLYAKCRNFLNCTEGHTD